MMVGHVRVVGHVHVSMVGHVSHVMGHVVVADGMGEDHIPVREDGGSRSCLKQLAGVVLGDRDSEVQSLKAFQLELAVVMPEREVGGLEVTHGLTDGKADGGVGVVEGDHVREGGRVGLGGVG